MKIKDMIVGTEVYVKASAQVVGVPANYTEVLAVIGEEYSIADNDLIVEFDDGKWWLVNPGHIRKPRKGDLTYTTKHGAKG